MRGECLPWAIGCFPKTTSSRSIGAHPPWAKDVMRPFAVISDGLPRRDTAVHEWVGLLVYWLTNRSSELFPGPTQGAR
jgi:hypothetical protein